MKQDNLLLPFAKLSVKDPHKLALSVGDRNYSYQELLIKVQHIAGWIKSKLSPDNIRVGLLVDRDISGYASIYASIWAGATYVPLNPKLPAERLKKIVLRSNLVAIIYDATNCEVYRSISNEIDAIPALLLNEDQIDAVPLVSPESVNASQGAYLMFTSGTTGEPKGILATIGNLKHYLDFMQQRYEICSADRISQVFELSFDASTFDLFMSINHGASFHTVPEKQLLAPALFIKKMKLTLWFGVPSHIAFMNTMRLLKPDSFPDLRVAIFGGEPLSKSSMDAWLLAAPNAVMDNVYGPTEVTVTCFVQRCNNVTPVTEDRNVMSIGRPYDGNYSAIVDEDASFLSSGKKGELLIAGPQVTPGYWLDEDLTNLRFRKLIHPKFGEQRWYFTGDWACEDENGVFHHLGRMDNQIKLSGHRVELEEIDATLRLISGSDVVATVAWPIEQGSARGIVAFICHAKIGVAEIRECIQKKLPVYMVPRRFIMLDSLPYTLNGKVDRKALSEKLSKEKN